MRIDLNWLAGELATVYRDETQTERQYTIAQDWQARLQRQIRATGDAAIANPDRPALTENATMLVDMQYVLIDEIIHLEGKQAQQDQIKAQIAELAARVGLTLADLEKLEHGHA